ncbi:hypothetical protein EW093_00605 [Thiospirochaeta perfilievii]|uniref:Uncharacterized protein n=1 Tax=Thiospirochaeta perfilievii TaxID=252967 RepID=A0A5C1Q5F5_9SPIO|nr:BTB/POZ domain-containing protein [Thiospirochaeta perfilievii]QEN03265.1 hypothetical protein EW093_00605 [Thiospirochaeta perfilievii]
METSRVYTKNIGKVYKKNYDKDLSSFKNEFEPIFIECCKVLPADISSEIFARFVTYSDREFKDALYNLTNLLELFEENYDVENDPFTKEEWEYIKLVINDSTDEFGLDLVKYMMQVMLDLGLI